MSNKKNNNVILQNNQNVRNEPPALLPSLTTWIMSISGLKTQSMMFCDCPNFKKPKLATLLCYYSYNIYLHLFTNRYSHLIPKKVKIKSKLVTNQVKVVAAGFGTRPPKALNNIIFYLRVLITYLYFVSNIKNVTNKMFVKL